MNTVEHQVGPPRYAGLAPAPVLLRPFATRPGQVAWFLFFALIARVHTFGDLNHHPDELLFFYVGQLMHGGALPYVDIWDRKPPSTFLLYYLLAGISRSVLSYQIAAWLAVALTAQTINCIAERFTGRGAAMLAGTFYLAVILVFGGAGGQPAVFFNLLTALAVLLVQRDAEALDSGCAPPTIFAAMALGGLAITFKQTALFESAWIGSYVVWRYGRAMGVAKALRLAVRLMLIGALPALAWTVFYAAVGHFGEFWHAMVTANLAKAYNPGGDLLLRTAVVGAELAPVFLLAVMSLAKRDADDFPRGFMIGWLLAASVGTFIIPNLIDHYLLPLLVPLTVASARFFGRGAFGATVGSALVALYLISGGALDVASGIRSRDATLDLVRDIRQHDRHPRLLVYDGPGYLYALTESHPPTPLIFPLHLSYLPENNTSHLNTVREFGKILAWRPTTVVVQRRPGANLYNRLTQEPLLAYIKGHCRQRFSHRLADAEGPMIVDVHTDCGAAG